MLGVLKKIAEFATTHKVPFANPFLLSAGLSVVS
jgi:hypothetical protein